MKSESVKRFGSLDDEKYLLRPYKNIAPVMPTETNNLPTKGPSDFVAEKSVVLNNHIQKEDPSYHFINRKTENIKAEPDQNQETYETDIVLQRGLTSKIANVLTTASSHDISEKSVEVNLHKQKAEPSYHVTNINTANLNTENTPSQEISETCTNNVINATSPQVNNTTQLSSNRDDMGYVQSLKKYMFKFLKSMHSGFDGIDKGAKN